MQRKNVAIYEYICPKCKGTIEISHPITDSPVILCATCAIARVKKFSLGAVTFKGGGWGKD
jgi:putative FmdB family regulatory protein